MYTGYFHIFVNKYNVNSLQPGVAVQAWNGSIGVEYNTKIFSTDQLSRKISYKLSFIHLQVIFIQGTGLS